ncbi:hypothetical protein ANCCAN_11999, partial [Ancylostoma caninum]
LRNRQIKNCSPFFPGFILFNDQFAVIDSNSLIFRGKPEWKCGADEEEEKKQKNCCVDPKSEEPSYHKPPYLAQTYKQPYTPSNIPAPRAYQTKGGFLQRMRDLASSAAETASLYARRIGRFLYGVGCKAARLLRTVAQYIWAFLKTFFTTSVPSKTLPATPKPFQPNAPPESPSFNKVEFKPEELAEAYEKEKVPMAPDPEVSYIQERQQLQEQVPPPMPAERQPPPVAMPRMYAAERPTYELDPAASIQAQRRYTDTSLDGREMRQSTLLKTLKSDKKVAPEFLANQGWYPCVSNPTWQENLQYTIFLWITLKNEPGVGYIARKMDCELEATPTLDVGPNIEEMHVSQQHPPPAPPPPPPTPFSKPQRIENTVNGREGVDQWESESSTARSAMTESLPMSTVKREPPGIGKLPADVMAELHGEIGPYNSSFCELR